MVVVGDLIKNIESQINNIINVISQEFVQEKFNGRVKEEESWNWIQTFRDRIKISKVVTEADVRALL